MKNETSHLRREGIATQKLMRSLTTTLHHPNERKEHKQEIALNLPRIERTREHSATIFLNF